MALLEIAKANAAKALGTTNFELPPSLRTVLVSKETSRGTVVTNNGANLEVSIQGLQTKSSESYCQKDLISHFYLIYLR